MTTGEDSATKWFKNELPEYCKKNSNVCVHTRLVDSFNLEITAPSKNAISLRLQVISHLNYKKPFFSVMFLYKHKEFCRFVSCDYVTHVEISVEQLASLKEKINESLKRFLCLSGKTEDETRCAVTKEYSAFKVILEGGNEIAPSSFVHDHIIEESVGFTVKQTIHQITNARVVGPCCVTGGTVYKLSEGRETKFLLFKALFFKDCRKADAVLYDGEGTYFIALLNDSEDNILGVIINNDQIVLTDTDKKLLDMIAEGWVAKLEKCRDNDVTFLTS